MDSINGTTVLLFFVLPVVLLVVMFAGVALVLRAAGFRPVTEDDGVEPAENVPRPWWGNPVLWLGVGAVFLLLGIFVAPHFIGGPILLLPFFWFGGRRRR